MKPGRRSDWPTLIRSGPGRLELRRRYSTRLWPAMAFLARAYRRTLARRPRIVAVVARRPSATIIRSWRDDSFEDLVLHDADFLGTVRDDSATSFVWWKRQSLTSVRFAQPPVLDAPRQVLDEEPTVGRPFVAQTRGLIGGVTIPLQTCLWIPLAPPGNSFRGLPGQAGAPSIILWART